MPRIEVIPNDWDQSEEKAAGNGTPTIDVCSNCKSLFVEGEAIDPEDFDEAPVVLQDATIGSVDVVHPPYEEGDYSCESCAAILGPEDN
jgi:hypothetical protein